MSRDTLRALVQAYAFNSTPPRDDLGTLHVPFESMASEYRVETRFDASVRHWNRVALIGRSGCGKSSLVSHVLGPAAEGVAPILVPVHALDNDAGRSESVADAVIAQLRLEATAAAASADRFDTVTGEQRTVVQTHIRRSGIKGGLMNWLSGDLSKEIGRQTEHRERIRLDAKVEVIGQCLQRIHSDGLEPVFVFDDTDRWAGSEHSAIVEGFYGEGIRWLTELRASVVVATHNRYLDDGSHAAELLAFLDTRVEIPLVPSAEQLARILQQRVHVLAEDPAADTESLPIVEVVTESAIEELYKQYRSRPSLRAVLQIAHIALVEAADTEADAITSHHIKAAVQAR